MGAATRWFDYRLDGARKEWAQLLDGSIID